MPSLRDISVPLATTALIVVFFCGLVAQYFTTLSAVKDGIQQVKEEVRGELGVLKQEVQQLKDQDKLHDFQLAQMNEAVKAATTYIGTGMAPDKHK